jgi:hypothetical protein
MKNIKTFVIRCSKVLGMTVVKKSKTIDFFHAFKNFNDNRNLLKTYSTFVIQSAKHVGIPPVGSLVMANT